MKSLSPRAKRLILALSQNEARKRHGTQILPEHVILALLKTPECVAFAMLQELNINILNYQLALEQSLMPLTNETISDYQELPPSRRLNNMISAADIESNVLGDEYIGTEHLFIAAVRESTSITSRFFTNINLTPNSFLEVLPICRKKVISSADEQVARHISDSILKDIMGFNSKTQKPVNELDNSSPVSQMPLNGAQNKRDNKSFLAEYSRDLIADSTNGSKDPVIGREVEIKRLIQILSRKTKNNPLLIGEPGVGKTAIVEGLASKIAAGKVPYNLLKKRVLSLDLTALIAGTKYRGEFEERMKRIMKEVKDNKNIILFIDELHTIIGAGGPEGSMDASNMLKPALSRGEMQVIGATTIREYRKYMEKDSALARRFQSINVDEPNDDETKLILEGIKKQYEEFHHVTYNDDVIPSIIKFSHRYFPERFLPDKAIDIMDEAGAEKKIQYKERPQEFNDIERNIDNLITEKDSLVKNQDYEKAALIRDKVQELKTKLKVYSDYWNGNSIPKRNVTVQDVCRIISTMTKIPIEQLDTTETSRLVHMEKEIHKSVIGQDEAISLIAGAVRRSRAGVSSVKKPIGSFIFLGPTGVGKTQLAKTLAKFLFGSEESLIRIDMSDFMEKHNASRLVGAPPGYVGYEEGGILTEKVRRNPYSVVLLDEIEKAHPDVFNLLLQLLEEGELSDNLGHTVNFRNTVIIMTSNAGAREITSDGRVGFSTSGDGVLSYNEIKSSAMLELKKLMSPELLNRIDDIVVFDALNRKQVNEILNLQLNELKDRLLEKDLKLNVKDAAREYMITKGYDPSFGARPMRRMIQRELEDPLSIMILDGECVNGSTITVDIEGEELKIKIRKTKKNPEIIKQELIEVK